MSALENLGEWTETSNYRSRTSAQEFLAKHQTSMEGINSACDAGEPTQKEEKPSACGSACGAGNPAQKEEKPSACGSACGAGEPAQKEEKPSAGGSSCGAGEPGQKN